MSVLLMAGGMMGTVVAEPMSNEEIDALKRTSDWFSDKAVEACGVSAGTTPIEGSDNAEKVWNFFIAKGYKPFQVAGIMGNMQHESGIQPHRLQGTGANVITVAAGTPVNWRFIQEDTMKNTPSTTGSGWGIVQWTPAGKFVNTQNPISKANEIGTQLEFLWGQLEGQPPLSEKKAGDDLKATTSIEQAVLAFQGGPSQNIGGQTVGPYTGYERPGNQTASIPQRYSAAKGFLARYGSGAPSSDTSTSSGASASGCASAAPGGGEVDMATVFQPSDTMTCPVGIDAGVQDGYYKGTLVKIRTCTVPSGTGTVTVNARIAKNVADLYAAAKAQGVVMGGGGFRTMAGQIAARKNNHCPDIYNAPSSSCSPPTAPPGWSNHQMGLAIDFNTGGGTISGSSAGFNWLKANAAQYGLKNLPSESWHWSVDGG